MVCFVDALPPEDAMAEILCCAREELVADHMGAFGVVLHYKASEKGERIVHTTALSNLLVWLTCCSENKCKAI